jgi:hypothetical protein
MKQQLAVEWGEFLSQFEWDWFVTLTFRDWVKSFRAHRLFDLFVRELEKAAGQRIFYFRVDEIGPQGGRFHLHALIGNVAHLRRMFWMDYWDKLAGHARILPFSSRRGAAFYVAKYVCKQLGEWELGGDLSSFRNNQRVLPLEGGSNRNPPAPALPPDKSVARLTVPGNKGSQRSMPFRRDQQDSDPETDISLVYKQEVTRGGTRFRQFNFPERTEKRRR